MLAVFAIARAISGGYGGSSPREIWLVGARDMLAVFAIARANQPALSAPSIRCSAPDTYSASSDSSHKTTLATSAAVP